MSTLAEIQAATERLPLDQQEQLYRVLGARLEAGCPAIEKARLVRQGSDTLLEAPSGAPPTTPENIKRMLEDWP